MKPQNNSAIYAIRNSASGKVYVGSAVSVLSRWNQHRSLLNKGKHHSQHLQSSWGKHGQAAFEFLILELVPDVAMLIERENAHIARLCATDPNRGYNLRKDAGERQGHREPAPLVAIRYAAWIEPSFEVRVYRAFRASVTDKSKWIGSRHQASASYRLMSDMLKMGRDDAGKETKDHHYSNEAKLVNWAFGGGFKKMERDSLCRADLDLLAYLEERNAMLIGRGVEYSKRKPMLQQYALDWRLEHSGRLLA